MTRHQKIWKFPKKIKKMNLKKLKNKKKFENYKNIVNNLEYCTESNQPTNQEALNLKFPIIHT